MAVVSEGIFDEVGSNLIQSRVGRKAKEVEAGAISQWMGSSSGRIGRILSEFLQVRDRLEKQRVLGTVMVFGSARTQSLEEWEAKHNELTKSLRENRDLAGQSALKKSLDVLNECRDMSVAYNEIRELTKMVTSWSLGPECRQAMKSIFDNVRGSWITNSNDSGDWILDAQQPSGLVVCSGGGPGMMEAANWGASMVPGGRSMGMGITLPFENELNNHIDHELAFGFHYFFTRKFWMTYCALGVVVAPGGYGTVDEIMELLTLKQCGKLRKQIPVVMFNKGYWKEVINWELMLRKGMVAQEDVDQLVFCDTATEAFDVLRQAILNFAAQKCDDIQTLKSYSGESTDVPLD